MTEIVTPFAQFFDTNGAPLNNGAIFIGTAYLDAQTNPILVFWDEALTIPAPQPIRTLNGYAVWNGAPARIFCNADNFSMTVQTSTGRTVWAVQDATSETKTSDIIFQDFAAPTGSSLVGFIQSGAGAVARTAQDKMRDTVSVEDFGAVGDGITDDTAAIQSAINAAITQNKILYWAGKTYRTTTPLTVNSIGVVWQGEGVENTKIIATTNFAQLLHLQSGSAEFSCSGITFETTGTTTRCVTITRGQTPHFVQCGFRGSFAGSLVYSTGDILRFSGCKWDMDSANTVGLELDEYNQNCAVDSNSRFGGIGIGLRVSRSGTNPRVEGLKLNGVFFINTGFYNVDLGNSFATTISGCVLDQANTSALRVSGGADCVLCDGSWLGLQPAATGTTILFESSAGGNHIISNNLIFGGNTGIAFGATASQRVGRTLIDGNVFLSCANQSLSLDSVSDAIIVNNQDTGTPSAGSWITAGTHPSKGSYKFDNNSWHTAAPALYDTGSTYRFGNDGGIVGRASDVAIGSGAVTSLTINHGLFRTPKSVLANISAGGVNPGSSWVNSIGATQFTLTWVNSITNPQVSWQAEV